MTIFSSESTIYKYLNFVFHICVLNILWIVCSIPIITIGASTTALYYSLRKMHDDFDCKVTKIFLESFRRNFKQSSCLTIVFGIIGVILYLDIQIYNSLEELQNAFWGIALILLIIVWMTTISYVFPLLSTFENTVVNTLKNAFLMGIGNFGRTIVVVGLNLIPIIIILFSTENLLVLWPVFLFFGFAPTAYINSKIFSKIFIKYVDV